MAHFKHLDEKNMNYAEHAKHALSLSGSCMKASLLLLVHAIYPDVFTESGTETIRNALKQHDNL